MSHQRPLSRDRLHRDQRAEYWESWGSLGGHRPRGHRDYDLHRSRSWCAAGSRFPCVLEISFQGPLSTATDGHTLTCYERGDPVHLKTHPLWERQLSYRCCHSEALPDPRVPRGHCWWEDLGVSGPKLQTLLYPTLEPGRLTGVWRIVSPMETIPKASLCRAAR